MPRSEDEIDQFPVRYLLNGLAALFCVTYAWVSRTPLVLLTLLVPLMSAMTHPFARFGFIGPPIEPGAPTPSLGALSFSERYFFLASVGRYPVFIAGLLFPDMQFQWEQGHHMYLANGLVLTFAVLVAMLSLLMMGLYHHLREE